MSDQKVYCSMAGSCPEQARCTKQFHKEWESYCARVRLIKVSLLEQAPVSRSSGPIVAETVNLDEVRIHVDDQGRETYYRVLRGGGRQIIASPEIGYGEGIYNRST